MQASTAATAEAPWLWWPRFAHRLLHHGLRGFAHSHRAHDSGDPPLRCFHRQRIIGMAGARRRRVSRDQAQLRARRPRRRSGSPTTAATTTSCALGLSPAPPGLAHRIGGLEKDYKSGAISTDPENHERMVMARREKIARIAADIPALEAIEPDGADTILVGWGGTYGHLRTAASELTAEGTRWLSLSSATSTPSRQHSRNPQPLQTRSGGRAQHRHDGRLSPEPIPIPHHRAYQQNPGPAFSRQAK